MSHFAFKTSALALFASASIFAMSTAPSSAQDRNGGIGDGALRDFIQQEFQQGDRGGGFGEGIRERREARMERRGELRDRLRDRLMEELEDNPELRDRLRERLREGIASRIRERIAERRDEGGCFFITRSLRDEDGDFLVIVRRRVCRD